MSAVWRISVADQTGTAGKALPSMEAANRGGLQVCTTHTILLRHTLYGEGAEFCILVADIRAKLFELR